MPALPVSVDLYDREGETMDMTVMGGINGYAVSSYTKAPNAALAFLEFASRKEWIARRCELLGIVPARADVVEEEGGVAEDVYDDLLNGRIYIMPGERAMTQVWASLGSLLRFIAEDGLANGMAYDTDDKLIAAMKKLDADIYSAIHTLS